VWLEDDMSSLIPIISVIAVFGSAVSIVWLLTDSARRGQQAKMAADFHGKLLDRLGSTRDFSDFLNSDGGSRFLDSLALQRESTPQDRTLRAMASGIVMAALGIGLAMFVGEIRGPEEHDFAVGVGFLSAVFISLGVGLLLAAWGTVKLSRRLGLLDPPASRVAPTAPPV
jgi:hypothetical protein